MTNTPHDKTYDSWDKLLNPEKLKFNLARDSTFLAAYELLHSPVVEKPQGFFRTSGSGAMSQEYKSEVLALHVKDVFHASCLWPPSFWNHAQEDIELIEKIRQHRNDIAHESEISGGR